MSFAYQTLFSRPRGSWVLFFNQWRLTPMQMEQMPNSNKSALKRACICRRHCYEGQAAPHPNWSTVIAKLLLIHLWSGLWREERSQLLCQRKLRGSFLFLWLNSIRLLARSPESDHQLSVVNIICHRKPLSICSSLSVGFIHFWFCHSLEPSFWFSLLHIPWCCCSLRGILNNQTTPAT